MNMFSRKTTPLIRPPLKHSIEDFHSMVVNSVIEVQNILFACLVLLALFYCWFVLLGDGGGKGRGVIILVFCCLIFVLSLF